MTEISNKDIALGYAVGLFDGEGSCSINIQADEKKGKWLYFRGRVQITISNNDRYMLEPVKKILGFRRKIYHQKRKDPRHNTNHLIISSKPERILKIIEVLEPFSHRKKELDLTKKACRYIIQRETATACWNYKELDFFEKNFVNPSKKIKGTSSLRGRPRKYQWRDLIQEIQS